ncbi:MAG: hypothetical protein NTW19_23855, partial [Planctomycetota bacterium]|nr:hypothetical protein [Planctomycetota bacterium]
MWHPPHDSHIAAFGCDVARPPALSPKTRGSERPIVVLLLLLTAFLALLASPASARGENPDEETPTDDQVVAPTPPPNSGPLTLDMRCLTPRIRGSAPVPVEADFHNYSPNILRGRLRLVARDAGRDVLRYTTQPLTLAPGKQRARLLLPLSFTSYNTTVEVQAAFLLDTGEEFRLAPLTLTTPGYAQRGWVIGVCAPGGRTSPAFQFLTAGLRLDRFNPDPRNRTILTVAARVLPDQLPASPLGLAAYDAMILPGAGFTELSEDQLAVLAAWTRAGGSLCVAFHDQPIPPFHAHFLRTLSGDAAMPVPLGGAGLGLEPDSQSPPVRVYTVDLGRLMVVHTPPESSDVMREGPWPGAIARFWKASAGQLKTLAAGQPWRGDLEVPAPERKGLRDAREEAIRRL